MFYDKPKQIENIYQIQERTELSRQYNEKREIGEYNTHRTYENKREGVREEIKYNLPNESVKMEERGKDESAKL